MKTIHWQEIKPYDVEQMQKIIKGEILVNREGQPTFDPSKSRLIKFSKRKKLAVSRFNIHN